MQKYLMSMLFLVLLTSCSTPEYKQAEAGCSKIGYSKFPVSVQKYSCQRMRYIDVPTGETVCTTGVEFGKIVERCKKITERQSEWYDSTCTGDVNIDTRRDWINNCTRQACFQTYGNVSCKID
jgi:hypothetical protein